MIEYNINKEKRTVVAFIKFGSYEETFKDSIWIFDKLYKALNGLQHKNEIYNRKYFNFKDKMSFPVVMSAKAKCNPEDEWNEEYGKQLARQRLVEKIKQYRSNSYCIIADLAYEINEFVM